MSKSRQAPKGGKFAYVDTICDLTKRGDIDGVVELLKGYWKDRKEHPWHRIYPTIEKEARKTHQGEVVSDLLVMIRDAVFGALDLHSLSLALDISASEILKVVLKGKDWPQARNDARAYCAKKVTSLIENYQLDYLDSSSLERDGFGYLVPLLEEAKLEEYRKAAPRIEDGILNLVQLNSSVHGRTILRQAGITSKTLPEADEASKTLLELYENYLIELETDTSRTGFREGPTTQLTLNGKPIDVSGEGDDQAKDLKQAPRGVQAPLTEYMGKPTKKKAGKQASRKRSTARRKRISEEEKAQ